MVLDSFDMFNAHEAECEAWLKKLPMCDECKEPIQSDSCYKLGDVFFCERCIDNSRLSTDSLIDY